ncbi:MAG: AarF/ABC1/UbiB kinase family protein [Rhodothermales bacterium]|nr:AarF/ABC1/UbiB kinase family protein [Rhodothermales bacterium]
MDNEEKDKASGDFPSTRFKRGKIAASTGLKMGANYARYVARRSIGGSDSVDARKRLHRRNAEDLFSQLTKLRGTALKMAQGLSMETSFLPSEFADVLSKAQYQVPAMNSALVRRIIRQNLGDYPENVFAEFDPNAIAAASLGQVHRARTKEGIDVAVKVQYPNVRESIDSDLQLMRGIAARFIGADAAEPYINEVGARLHEETDYVQEGNNIEFFADVYNDTNVVTPRWLPDLTTTKVLTMTFVDGVHLNELMEGNPSQEERDAFGQILFDFAHDQITGKHLAVHVDAHPGNFLFREDGKIGILDFGCIKRFPQKFRDDLVGLFVSTLQHNRDSVLQYYTALDFLREDQSDEQRMFMTDILDKATGILVEPYREDTYDFTSTAVVDGFREMIPKLTGKEAFKNRAPVGSHHFVFVNRLVLGFYSILSGLQSRIDVTRGRDKLISSTSVVAQ